MRSTTYLLFFRAVVAFAIGGGVGLYFNQLLAGLLVAAVSLVIVHSVHLSRLEEELSDRDSITVPDGTGAWAQTLARINYLNLRIERSKQRFRLLLREVRNSTNAMPDGVVALNQSFEILRFNKSARRALGLKKRRDRGQRIDNLLRTPDFVSYLANGDFSGNLVISSPVRDDAWLSMRVVAYGAGLWLLLVRDITEQQRLARMRRDFVANASHELRTPLTVISGYLDALTEDVNINEEWERPLREMRSQADRMSAIVAGLLELSRMESADFSREHEWIDVAALLKSEVSSATQQIGGPNIELRLETTAGIVGVAYALDSVVSNLIQNAVNYTPSDGQVTVTWSELEDGDGVLSVLDNGEGIAEEDLPRITERFFRVNRGRSRGNGGTGLGLAIVKHALKMHDADLQILSELGVGSEFRCYFPAKRLRISRIGTQTVNL